MPTFGSEELKAVEGAFSRNWVGLGMKVANFESAWEDHIGSGTAIAVNSATAALHLAINLLELPKDSEIIVPSLTFASTATAVLYNGLTPVFADVTKDDLQINTESIKELITPRTKAIVVVHYAGHPAPIDRICKLAEEHGIFVIEDCAHTTGALFKGQKLGTWGHFGCFSFEEKKLMTTGDGGMLLSNKMNDEKSIRKMKALRWVGIDKDNWKSAQNYTKDQYDAKHWFYELNHLGYKYNMNDLCASIGIEQLKKLCSFNSKRSQVIDRYLNKITWNDNLQPLVPYETDNYVYQMMGIRTSFKDEMIKHLKSFNVATGCHYTPLNSQNLFSEYRGKTPIAQGEYERMITLPLHVGLENGHVDYVCEKINEFINKMVI